MKAIVQDTYCGPEVLELRDIDQPVPRDDEVLVRAHTAGLDRGVWHVMTGLPYMIRLFQPSDCVNPRCRYAAWMLPGGSKRGRQVTRFSPGDEVFGRCDGSYAEYATAGEDDFAVLDMKEPEPRLSN